MIKIYLNVLMLLYEIKVWIHCSRLLQTAAVVLVETVSILLFINNTTLVF